MKAIVVREFGGPDVMKLEELPDPSPGPQQVLVRVRAAGVNPVETYIRAGSYARLPSLPYIPGTDFAGTIEAVGSEVKKFKPGDRVYGHGVTRGQGAYHALNHRSANYVDQVMPLTGGRGVDVIIEMLANVNLDRDLDMLALRGRVVVVGNRGRIEIDPRKAMGKDSEIRGMTLFNASPEELAGIHAGIGAGLELGTLNPVVGREFPLADATKAHLAVMESGAHGKIVLIP